MNLCEACAAREAAETARWFSRDDIPKCDRCAVLWGAESAAGDHENEYGPHGRSQSVRTLISWWEAMERLSPEMARIAIDDVAKRGQQPE